MASVNQWLLRAKAEREITEDVAETFARFLFAEYLTSAFPPSNDDFEDWGRQFANELESKLDGL